MRQIQRFNWNLLSKEWETRFNEPIRKLLFIHQPPTSPVLLNINAELLCQSRYRANFFHRHYLLSLRSLSYFLLIFSSPDDIARLAAAFSFLFFPPSLIVESFVLLSPILFHSVHPSFYRWWQRARKRNEQGRVSSTKNLGFRERIESLRLNLNAVRQFDYRREGERRDQALGSIIGTSVRVSASFFFSRKKMSRSPSKGKTNGSYFNDRKSSLKKKTDHKNLTKTAFGIQFQFATSFSYFKIT